MAERPEGGGEGKRGDADEVLPVRVAPATIATVSPQIVAMMPNTDLPGAAVARRCRADRRSSDDGLAGLDVPARVVGDQALVARSELVWMPGVGHMPNLERADELDAARRRRLDALAAA